DEDMRMQIRHERGGETRLGGRARELTDQFVGADKACFVAVLNRAVRDRDAEVRLPRAARATENRVFPLTHELGSQVAAEHLQLERRLEGEVEVIDRTEKRE